MIKTRGELRIIEDHYDFILHQKIKWTDSDVDYAVSMVKDTQEQFPEMRSASFIGVFSSENRIIFRWFA